MRGLTDEALREVEQREERLRNEARAGSSRLKLAIAEKKRELEDLQKAERMLVLKAGEHEDRRVLARAYLDMRGKT